MFNIIYGLDHYKTVVYYENRYYVYNKTIKKFLNDLCVVNGTTFKGALNANHSLLPNIRKIPIYLALFDDYIIPLINTNNNLIAWFSFKNFLSCKRIDGKTYIKFIDRSMVEIACSLFTINAQYDKCFEINRKRRELKINEFKFLTNN